MLVSSMSGELTSQSSSYVQKLSDKVSNITDEKSLNLLEKEITNCYNINRSDKNTGGRNS